VDTYRVFVAPDAEPAQVLERVSIGQREGDALASVPAKWARAAALVTQSHRTRRARCLRRAHVEVRRCTHTRTHLVTYSSSSAY
jgi:hypothetical protein